jgi:hypothetical protein
VYCALDDVGPASLDGLLLEDYQAVIQRAVIPA